MTTYPEPTSFPTGASLTDGVWTQVLSPRSQTQGRPALFLDRDGVVVEDAHYLHQVEKVQLTPNAAHVVKAANANAIPVILVTNQAGVGYGYFKWDDFIAVQGQIIADLQDGGAHIDGVFACPFHAKGQTVYAHEDHPARKPNPGMLHLAQQLMGVDLQNSWIVGDRRLDVLAGKNAGLKGGVHVLTGHGSKEGERAQALSVGDETYSVKGVENLHAALSVLDFLGET